MNLIRHLFDEETRASSGKCGKRQLNPSIMKKVITACLQVFPLESNETVGRNATWPLMSPAEG